MLTPSLNPTILLLIASACATGLPLRSEATLIGDSIGACVLNYPGCVANPTPGVNESGTLNQALAIVGAGPEFLYEPNGFTLDFTADFDDVSPLVGSLQLRIRNSGIISITTQRTDTGWVFTGIDDPIANVFLLGGDLGISSFSWDQHSIGVNFDPWTIPAVSPDFKTAQFEIQFVPEPSTGALVAVGLVSVAIRRRRGPSKSRKPARTRSGRPLHIGSSL